MSKELLGDVCAYIPSTTAGGKANYPRIGVAFKDGDRISIKIDTIPFAGSRWEGWINIYPRRTAEEPTPGKSSSANFDDDIPF